MSNARPRACGDAGDLVQDRELPYATRRYMHYPHLSQSFEGMCVRLNYARRMLCCDGDAEIAPGDDGPCGRRALRWLPFARVALSWGPPTSVISTRT
jgi:hypothetical protein